LIKDKTTDRGRMSSTQLSPRGLFIRSLTRDVAAKTQKFSWNFARQAQRKYSGPVPAQNFHGNTDAVPICRYFCPAPPGRLCASPHAFFPSGRCEKDCVERSFGIYWDNESAVKVRPFGSPLVRGMESRTSTTRGQQPRHGLKPVASDVVRTAKIRRPTSGKLPEQSYCDREA
jgi:hypothetical protein